MTAIPAFNELDRIVELINDRSQPVPPKGPGEIRQLMDAVRAMAVYAVGAWKSVWRSWLVNVNLDYPAHAEALALLLREASASLVLVDAALARSIDAGLDVDDAAYWQSRQKLDGIRDEFLRAWPSLISPIDRAETGWREFETLPVLAWDEASRRPYLVAPAMALAR